MTGGSVSVTRPVSRCSGDGVGRKTRGDATALRLVRSATSDVRGDAGGPRDAGRSAQRSASLSGGRCSKSRSLTPSRLSDHPHQRVFLVGARCRRRAPPPRRLDHAGAVLVRHRLLDRAGEAHGVGRFGLQRLGLGPQRRGLARREPVAGRDDPLDPVDLGAGIVVVGAREAHQQRGEREAGVVVGERLGGGARRDFSRRSNMGVDIAAPRGAANHAACQSPGCGPS